jgi:hypothetical protein
VPYGQLQIQNVNADYRPAWRCEERRSTYLKEQHLSTAFGESKTMATRTFVVPKSSPGCAGSSSPSRAVGAVNVGRRPPGGEALTVPGSNAPVGLCHIDPHLINDWEAALLPISPPFTLGHENTATVWAIRPGVQ